MKDTGVLARYGSLLDIPAHTTPISLQEGSTPLIAMPRLAAEMGGGFELFVKFEGMNPTGSFKDRGMTVAISEAAGRGAKAVICASTGNTAASAAAYAARAGLRAIVIIPDGKVAAGKLAGAVAYGAEVIQITGSFDDALNLVVAISQHHPIALVNSLNPYRLEGQKTAAFEICEDLGQRPRLVVPAGGQCRQHYLVLDGLSPVQPLHSTGLPRILGVQAAGSAPLVLGHPVTIPKRWRRRSGLAGPRVANRPFKRPKNPKGRSSRLQTMKSWPCSAAWPPMAYGSNQPPPPGWPVWRTSFEKAQMDVQGKRVVAVCTGHGLKDPDIIAKSMPAPRHLPAQLAELEAALLGEKK